MAEKQDIEAIAELACLKIDKNEIESYQNHFAKILNYFETLQSVETQGVSPMITPHGIQPPLREDKVVRDLTVDEVLQNAPEVKDGLFKVPPVV